MKKLSFKPCIMAAIIIIVVASGIYYYKRIVYSPNIYPIDASITSTIQFQEVSIHGNVTQEKLKSLDKLPLLESPFKFITVKIKNCHEASSNDFNEVASALNYLYAVETRSVCQDIEQIQTLKPSKESYLQNFTLLQLSALPATLIYPAEVDSSALNTSQLIGDSVSIQDLAQQNKLVIQPRKTVLLAMDEKVSTKIVELGRGDLNNDGIEDILLEQRINTGLMYKKIYYLLTKKSANDTINVTAYKTEDLEENLIKAEHKTHLTDEEIGFVYFLQGAEIGSYFSDFKNKLNMDKVNEGATKIGYQPSKENFNAIRAKFSDDMANNDELSRALGSLLTEYYTMIMLIDDNKSDFFNGFKTALSMPALGNVSNLRSDLLEFLYREEYNVVYSINKKDDVSTLQNGVQYIISKPKNNTATDLSDSKTLIYSYLNGYHFLTLKDDVLTDSNISMIFKTLDLPRKDIESVLIFSPPRLSILFYENKFEPFYSPRRGVVLNLKNSN